MVYVDYRPKKKKGWHIPLQLIFSIYIGPGDLMFQKMQVVFCVTMWNKAYSLIVVDG